MKKSIYFNILLLVITMFLSSTLFAADNPQENKKSKKEQKAEAIKKMISEKKYVFEAQSALPMSMPNKQLSYGYELKVTADSIIAYLPYYGRAYVAPIGNDGGIDFTSTKFDYKVEEVKNGWNIDIEIKDDPRHSYKLSLFVSESGMANLMVNDNTRQSISFNGRIGLKE